MFTLRDYQRDLVDRTWTWLQSQRGSAGSILSQLPTGGGKTACQAELVRREYQRGGQCLIAVHRIEILHQIAATVHRHTGVRPELITAGSRPDWKAPILVAMNPTLARRLRSVPDSITLLLQDEAHHAVSNTYQALYDALPDTLLSGWTATAERLDGQPLRDVFDHLECGPGTRELIEWGHLAPFRYLAVPLMTTRGVGMRGGDFIAADIARVNRAVHIAAGVVDSYLKHARGKQTIVFAVSVAHSRQIAFSLAEAEVNAVHVDGSTPPEERARAIADFKAGRIQVLCNCALFGEGVDIPAVEAVILARPTASLTVHLQQIGRVLRLHPGKEEAIILDVAKNWERHGFPDDHRNWTLDGRDISPTGSRATVEEDEDENREAEPREIVEGTAQLEQIASSDALNPWSAVIDRLILRQQSHRYKPAWMAYRLAEDPVASRHLEAWELLGKHLGYRPGWAWHKWQEATGQSHSVA